MEAKFPANISKSPPLVWGNEMSTQGLVEPSLTGAKNARTHRNVYDFVIKSTSGNEPGDNASPEA